jgi:adenosine kinase
MPDKKSKILVVGSIAYDHVMDYGGYFKDAIVNGNYNISLIADNRNISYGGCGGNAAYTLKLLGEEPVIFSCAGRDFSDYKKRLSGMGIATDYIAELKDGLTASAFILTDKEENQITLFEPGASKNAHTLKSIKGFADEIVLAIISPDNCERMVSIAKECSDLQIPFIFDPGQQTPQFKDNDLKEIIGGCEILIANRYESMLLEKRAGLKGAKCFIQTLGPDGVAVTSRNDNFVVKAVEPAPLVDPTGSGDAFRAGLLMGMRRGFDLKKSCRVGALCGTYAVEKKGTQVHFFTYSDFAERFNRAFGENL